MCKNQHCWEKYQQPQIHRWCHPYGITLLMKVKDESEKAGLKLNIQKMKITVSSPMTYWQMGIVQTVTDFIFLGSKITVDGDCSHEIRRHLLLERKVMTNLDSILEKTTATHSSTLAWKIPWTEEPGGLQSMGSLRVGHDWVTSLLLFTFMHWRRKWQPTPVFLPGESQGWGSLVGCRLWGRTESDTTEVT